MSLEASVDSYSSLCLHWTMQLKHWGCGPYHPDPVFHNLALKNLTQLERRAACLIDFSFLMRNLENLGCRSHCMYGVYARMCRVSFWHFLICLTWLHLLCHCVSRLSSSYPYSLSLLIYNIFFPVFSCYANVILQCLAFTPPLTSYLLQGLHSKACKLLIQLLLVVLFILNHIFHLMYILFSTNMIASFVIWFLYTVGVNREWCFTCEFERLILKAKEGGPPLSPIGILSHIQKIGSHLSNGREEDAHEFLR